jgi:hypothetical protein
MTPRIIARLALGTTFLLALAGSPASGQDDALKKLLEKLESPAPAPKTDEKKPDGKKTDGKTPDQKKPIGDDRDKAVDSFLEKLGGGRDEAPTAKGKAPSEIGPDSGLPGEKPIDAKDENLDEHLERLLGRIKKDKDEQEGDGEGGQGQSPEGGRLAETVKKMREVEQRLTKLDTGQDTRKTQDQIVGELDQLLKRIQQMKQQQQQQGQQKGAKMAGQGQGQGQQPGGNPGDQPGGAPPQQPKTPDPSTGLAGAKDSWGHLPGTLREVMENVSRMQPLPEKKELVERYFLSVAKRSLSRAGGE